MARTAVVTGGASGVGTAICEQLSADGHRVAVLDLDADGAAQVASGLRAGSRGVGVDVADAERLRGAIDERIVQRIIPAGRIGSPGDVTAVASFLCSEGAGYVTGQVVSPNGGAST